MDTATSTPNGDNSATSPVPIPAQLAQPTNDNAASTPPAANDNSPLPRMRRVRRRRPRPNRKESTTTPLSRQWPRPAQTQLPRLNKAAHDRRGFQHP